MAGQAFGIGISGVKSAIAQIKEHGGISEEETSTIGGEGRKGSDGHGENMAAPHKNIAEEFCSKMGGNATTGTTGYGSGHGKTS